MTVLNNTARKENEPALQLVHSVPADDSVRRQVRALAAQLGSGSASLVPILREIKRTRGHIPPAALEEIAAALSLDYGKVHRVASFYSLLSNLDRELALAS